MKKYFSTDFKLFELVDYQMSSEEPVAMTFNLEDSPINEKNASRPIEIHNSFEEKRRIELLQLQATISEV